MKTAIRIFGLSLATLSLVLVCGTSTESLAAKKNAKTSKVKAVSKLPEGVNLQTDINFSGSTLRGKYQTPTEALAKVEQEKSLDDLLIPRMHFKDRLEVQTKQR